jgi:hypothetical protein
LALLLGRAIAFVNTGDFVLIAFDLAAIERAAWAGKDAGGDNGRAKPRS